MWDCGWLTGGYGGGGNYLWGFGPFGGIVGILVIIVLIVLVYQLFKAMKPSTNAASDKNDSFMILKARFARGEISLDEYQRMKETLTHQ